MQSKLGLGQVTTGVFYSLVTDLNLAPLGYHWIPQSHECSAEYRLGPTLNELFLSHFCSEPLSYNFAKINVYPDDCKSFFDKEPMRKTLVSLYSKA